MDPNFVRQNVFVGMVGSFLFNRYNGYCVHGDDGAFLPVANDGTGPDGGLVEDSKRLTRRVCDPFPALEFPGRLPVRPRGNVYYGGWLVQLGGEFVDVNFLAKSVDEGFYPLRDVKVEFICVQGDFCRVVRSRTERRLFSAEEVENWRGVMFLWVVGRSRRIFGLMDFWISRLMEEDFWINRFLDW